MILLICPLWRLESWYIRLPIFLYMYVKRTMHSLFIYFFIDFDRKVQRKHYQRKRKDRIKLIQSKKGGKKKEKKKIRPCQPICVQPPGTKPTNQEIIYLNKLVYLALNVSLSFVAFESLSLEFLIFIIYHQNMHI